MAVGAVAQGPVAPAYPETYATKLPDLVVKLDGAIDAVLDGRIDFARGGGKRDRLVDSTDVRDKAGDATVKRRDQNGAAESLRPRLRVREAVGD